MERITAFCAGRSVLADMNHFLYIKKKTVAEVIYLSCRESTCMASIKWQHGATGITIIRPHNHKAIEEDYQELLFRQSLRLRSSVENTPIRTIFLQEQQQNRLGSQRITFGDVSSLMYRARRAGTPPIPNSVEQFSGIIAEQRWFQRYGRDMSPNEDEFFRTILHSDNNIIAIFMSESVRRYVATHEDCLIHLDATFKIVPRNGMGTQLFIIHVHAFSTAFPLLLAFMQKKTEEGYLEVLQYLQKTVVIEPAEVMADYESVLRKAVCQVWPNSRLLGCWFHYAQAVFRRSRQLGLQENDRQKQLTKVSMVLPLLPQSDIHQGIAYLEKEGINGQFLNYLRRQWEGQDISVYGEDQRSNNSVEFFHRDLFTRVGRPHSSIWALIDILRFVEHKKVCDLQKLMSGRTLTWRRRPRYLRGNGRLARYQQLFTVTKDIPEYLISVSHLADRLVRLFEPTEAIDLYGQENGGEVENLYNLLEIVNQGILDMDTDEGEENETDSA